MKKTLFALAALAALVSCQSLKEEWQPVVNCQYPVPDIPMYYSEGMLKDQFGMEEVSTIAQLKSLYKGSPVLVSGNVWVKGQVTTSDQSGNIYNEIYIQDLTGALDLKLGKSSLYDEYKLGQWVYVKCDGLTIGVYNGMPQLGFAADDTISNEYDTSYIQLPAMIDEHVFRSVMGDVVAPAIITEADIKAAIAEGTQSPLWGKLVTVNGLTYGNEIFALFYPNSNMAHKSSNPENRVFLSDNGTWGVNTWSCTKAKYVEYLQSGVWDTAEVGSGATKYGPITGRPVDYLPADVLSKFGPDASLTYKEIMIKYASANYISHYFKLGKTDVQVRTSGYAKFAATELPAAILAGNKVGITGIITVYNGAAQFSLVDDPSISVIVE